MFRSLFLLVLIVGGSIFAATPPQPHQPLVFEPNRGQAPSPVKWIARGQGFQLFLTEEGLTMKVPESGSRPYTIVKMKLSGSRPWRKTTGMSPTGGNSNYVGTNDSAGTLTDIPQYEKVKVTNIYDGVDLVFYSNQGDLGYDFVVKPGADPAQIHLDFEGQERMRVDSPSGDLVLTTPSGFELRQNHPKIYQQIGLRQVEMTRAYKLLDPKRTTFTLASYDVKRPVVN
jgi:hypothetical protein